jgi:hypothetical protein
MVDHREPDRASVRPSRAARGPRADASPCRGPHAPQAIGAPTAPTARADAGSAATSSPARGETRHVADSAAAAMSTQRDVPITDLFAIWLCIWRPAPAVRELFALVETLEEGPDTVWWTFTLPIPCSLWRRVSTGRLTVHDASPVQPKGCLPPFSSDPLPGARRSEGALTPSDMSWPKMPTSAL